MKDRAKALLLLVLCVTSMASAQFAAAYGRLCVAAEFGCHSDVGSAVLAVTGFCSGVGVEAAGILLCVNPWLALGIGASFAA